VEFRRTATLVGYLAILLAACMTPAESPTTEDESDRSLTVDSAADRLPQFTLIRVGTYPQNEPLPRRLLVGDLTVPTRLDCPNGRTRIVPGFEGQMTLRELAHYLTQTPASSTPVVLKRSPSLGVLLQVDRDGSLISRVSIYRNDSSWFPSQVTRCARHK
jgi:hypothetical protein